MVALAGYCIPKAEEVARLISPFLAIFRIGVMGALIHM